MRAKIYITITDDTPEEKLATIGQTPEKIRKIYEDTFELMLNAACAPGCTYELHVSVDDNTKEARQ